MIDNADFTEKEHVSDRKSLFHMFNNSMRELGYKSFDLADVLSCATDKLNKLDGCSMLYIEFCTYHFYSFVALWEYDYAHKALEMGWGIGFNRDDRDYDFVRIGYINIKGEESHFRFYFDIGRYKHIEGLDILLDIIAENRFDLAENLKSKGWRIYFEAREGYFIARRSRMGIR
jgi:hypothetical protein